MPFGRLITAMVTPMKEDLSVDYSRAEQLVEHLIDSGSDSLVVTGTTGESPTLSSSEKLQLYRVVVGAAAGRAKVIAGTGTYNTSESILLTAEAYETGVNGCMLVVPYYNNPPQEGLYEHFAAIAEQTPLPVILYNVPSRSPRNMEAATTLRLAHLPNVVAIKEASGKLEQIAEILAGAPEGFRVYSGDDSATLPLMSMGAHGVVSVASHVAGRLIRRMLDAFAAGKIEEAAELHVRLTPLFKACFVTTNPIPIKAAMALQGLPCGGLRLPLLPANDTVIEGLRRTMNELGLLALA